MRAPDKPRPDRVAHARLDDDGGQMAIAAIRRGEKEGENLKRSDAWSDFPFTQDALRGMGLLK